MSVELKPASKYERKIFYKEEWNVKDVPDFIRNSLTSREFGFDHYGNGPNDRYKVFVDDLRLKRFIKVKQPFAAYCSVAFYDKPNQRKGWQKSELVFDVDAKDIPIRTCDCAEGEVCEKCLNQAKEIVLMIRDVLSGDFGLTNINLIYSGRGYHVRVLDEDVMDASSELRGDIIQYVTGSKLPDLSNEYGFNEHLAEVAAETELHKRHGDKAADSRKRRGRDLGYSLGKRLYRRIVGLKMPPLLREAVA